MEKSNYAYGNYAENIRRELETGMFLSVSICPSVHLFRMPPQSNFCSVINAVELLAFFVVVNHVTYDIYRDADPRVRVE